MNDNEYYSYEDRYYINPTLSSDEQNRFIDNLRDIQSQNNAQIAQQTYNLGTRVPSNLGGLGGGEAYFNARYQTPQVNEMTATLKAAADAQALNDVMSNYQQQLKQKYNNAYRSAQRRASAAAAQQYPTTATGGNVIEEVDISSTATPEGLYQEMLRHQSAQQNKGQAEKEAEERAKYVSQALNPIVDVTTTQDELINYWKNIRR